ncbi:MAG: phosphatidylinositol-specific phospholipase C1-like protein [Reichenbachiella sp.]|uniref:phosphatidylinositol-specific phospholipase C1-like protein n=1 Tax=Reichenbachiella sp. TaxID=2184521 RepID=UPI0032649E7E
MSINKIQLLALISTVIYCGCVDDSDSNQSLTKLNEIQLIGSHNSYKQAIEQPLLDYVAEITTRSLAESLEYEHISLEAQLNLGLRNLELDLYYDPEGGRYTNPQGLDIVIASGNTPLPYDEEGKLQEPGLKLFHVQDVDFRSHHLLFKDALISLKNWSDANPDHTPIFILIEAKDDVIEMTIDPLPFTQEAIATIDTEINEIFSSDHLILPDQIRGGAESLEQGMLDHGWPSLDESKGKLLFILNENETKTNRYLEEFPGLRNATLFVNKPEGHPEAAIIMASNPLTRFDDIQRLVSKGYIVRTLTDSETIEARANDLTRFASAQASGAQLISTDFYLRPTLFDSDYQVIFDDGTYERLIESGN